MASTLQPSKLHFTDLVRAATIGIRTRKQRAALSAIGIMIGIAAMVAVLGLSQSSKSELLAQLERLGTNLLTVQPDAGLGRGTGTLPAEATDMIARIGPIESTSMLSAVSANVYRNDLIPAGKTGGISVQAVDQDLLDVLGGSMADGVWFDDARAAYPNVVLGSVAAERLGVRQVSGTSRSGWLIAGSPSSASSTCLSSLPTSTVPSSSAITRPKHFSITRTCPRGYWFESIRPRSTRY